MPRTLEQSVNAPRFHYHILKESRENRRTMSSFTPLVKKKCTFQIHPPNHDNHGIRRD
jgi:hypothetical protein